MLAAREATNITTLVDVLYTLMPCVVVGTSCRYEEPWNLLPILRQESTRPGYTPNTPKFIYHTRTVVVPCVRWGVTVWVREEIESPLAVLVVYSSSHARCR